VIPAFALEHDQTIEKRYRGLVTVTCSGQGCFEPQSRHASLTKPVDLMKLLGASATKLKAGRTLSVTLAVPGYDTRIDSWAIGAKGVPVRTTQCIPLGESRARATC
jgi:hypothetical protein